MKIVIDNQESDYLRLLCAIKAEIKLIRASKRVKLMTPLNLISDTICKGSTETPIY
mgnify:CR=1 FL=1